MSSTSTPTIALFKATPGSAEPFRTTDLNSNSDKIDSAVAALDTRLDLVEANDWVTSARIASNAVGASEIASDAVTTAKILDANVTVGKLAASLDLTGKTVNVATQAAGTVNTLAASTAFVVARIAEKSLPTLIKAGVTTGTTGGGGDITQSFTGLGFSGTPVVTGTLNPAAAGASSNLVVTISSTSSSAVVFRIYDAAGNVASAESVTINWIAVQS